MDFNLIFNAPLIAGATLTDYFLQSNFAGQVIVVILLVFSILAWGVMICKKADLSAMEAMNAKTARVLKSSTLADTAASRSIEGPYAKLVKEAVNAWMQIGIGNSQGDRAARIAYVENTLQRTLARQIMLYNSKMTLLGTIISGAPFLGLLGTAWGVMDSFGSMSAQTSVTLQMLAPGVAGALLTTVAGLVVAIPSVFGYNYLTTRAGALTTETENFASLIADRIEIESLEYSKAEEPPRREPPAPLHARRTEDAARPQRTPDISGFSLDDDDSSRPTPPRQFDE